MADTAAATVLGPHGAKQLPSVEVDSYNLELKDDEGFLGDDAILLAAGFDDCEHFSLVFDPVLG